MALTSPRALQERSDPGLLDQIAAGDPGAIAALYHDHARELYRFIARRVRGPVEDIEEILQDTMLAAITGARRFRRECTVRTWLCGIARNQVLQRQRTDLRKKRIPPSQTLSLDESTLQQLHHAGITGQAIPRDLAEEIAVKELVRRILDEMDEEARDLLLLRYVDDFSVREMAQLLGRGERSIEGLLRRARQRAKEIGARYL